MQQIPITFKFKGQRTYVHGTDMYNSIIAQIDQQFGSQVFTSLRFTIHNQATGQGNLLLGNPNEIIKKPEQAIAEFSVATSQGKINSWLTETEQAVQDRYVYNEDSIGDLCQIEGNQIKITNNSVYTPIEVVVAMNKFLHLHVINEIGIKWFFTRLELERAFQPTDTPNLKVVLKNRFGNNKLTKSTVYVGEQPLGYIYFSAVQK